MQRHSTTIKKILLVASFQLYRLFAIAVLPVLIAGCGQTGAPQPPSLQLPTQVDDLAASRTGNQVTLKWTMPRRTTDKLPLKGPQPVHICRRVNDGSCEAVIDTSFPPEKAATYTETLPLSLATGPAQLLTYDVEVRSRHGNSAGPSNPASIITGEAPPTLDDLRGEITATGVLLQWQTAKLGGGDHKLKIFRTLLSPAAGTPKSTNKSPFSGSSPSVPSEQTLVVRLPGGPDTGRALDPDAAFNQRYGYRAVRIATVSVGGKTVDVEGPISAQITVTTKDIFPPRPPSALAAVAAPEEGAIDLSWTPNTEPDLAGYAVYRSEAGSQPTRISSESSPFDTPSYRDLTARPGVQYTYSVKAIDRDGNVSAPSAEATETLPAKP